MSVVGSRILHLGLVDFSKSLLSIEQTSMLLRGASFVSCTCVMSASAK